MYKALLLTVAVAALAGCTTSRQITGQDGKPVHAISCNGARNSMQSCYEKAGDVCGTAGFDVMGTDGSSTPFGLLRGKWSPAGGSLTGQQGAIVNRGLTVRCRNEG